MPEDHPEPATMGGAPEAGQSAQTIEPALGPGRSRRKAAPDRHEDTPAAGRPVSVARGDIPEALKRRYFTEEGRLTTAFFAGPGAKIAAFRDHGAKLTTHQVDPAAIRDMTMIAAHRGWRTIQVRGDDDFRREVWMEARATGLEVRGYRPRQRDTQELEARRAADARRTLASAAARDRREAADGDHSATQARPGSFDSGVRGVLLEVGEAPYRRRAGRPLTPFIRLDRGDGRALDIWGAGLPEALARSGAKPGDQVLVRRDGVDRIRRTIEQRDRRTGETRRQEREVARNRWTIVAERFRQASPAEAARDPELQAAQSQLAVVRTVIQAALGDPAGRARAFAQAHEQIAAHLAQGRPFRTARVQEQARTVERAQPSPGHPVDRTASPREQASERTRRR